MDAFALLLPFAPRRHAAALASDLVERSVSEVWDRGYARALEMTPAEGKGYLRALAVAAVQSRLTDGVLRARGIAPSAREELVGLAAEGVAERLIGEVSRMKRACVRRRAA